MVVPQGKLPSAWIFGKFFLRVLILSFKVCIIKNFSNSGVHNLTSTHDSLNLKGSAESGEKNEYFTQFSLL